jgi:hypothetical protein
MRAVAWVLVLGLAGLARAEDVIVLDNGREARGRIVEESDSGVRLDIGGGKMFYARARIREVRRDAAPAEKPAAAQPEPTAAEREEYALLYDDGRRVGTRTLRVAAGLEGFRFDEEIVVLDEKGAPLRQIRTTERDDVNLRPVSFQVRESSGETNHTLVVGEVRGGRLYLTSSKDGERRQEDRAVPADGRFAFGARELFLRESKALGGAADASVYDVREMRWRPVSYCEAGTKLLDEQGAPLTVRVLQRKRGELVEREWIDERLVTRMAELDGEKLRAMASTADVVGRVKRGDVDKVTGPDSSARVRYADAEQGFRIAKPDPSWTFEEPAGGQGALVVIRNAPLFATVDVLRDLSAPADVTLERGSESLQRQCRAAAADFRVVKDGFQGEGAARSYWLEASATTKGEKTRTLARLVVQKGRVFRLLAACPAAAFDALRPDFEKILSSFALD